MKKKKRIFAIILAAVSVLLMCAPLISFAQVRVGEGEATLLQEGEFDIATGESIHRAAPQSTLDTVANNVYMGLLSYSNRIDVSQAQLSQDEVDAFYSNVINDNPDLFYVSSSYRFYYSQSSGKVTAIVPQYAMEQNEVEAALDIFYAGVEKALKEVDSSMSDLQKALTLHDYICAYAIYPNIYDSNGYYDSSLDLDIYHSAYGFLKNNIAVCAGYTLTYSYLLKQLGIDCEYVSSDDMEHAWNKVKIDGKWYNVDITFDNADFNDAENTYGLAYHTCFMKSDSFFQSENGMYHYNYLTYDAANATDTSYDSAFWDDVNSRIYTVNGDYYYMNPNYNSQNAVLTKRTTGGTETTIGTSYRAATFSITRYAKDSSGTMHEIPHRDILIRLLYLDGKFFVNDYNNIYAVTMNGTKYTAFSKTGYLISLGSVDGNLVYQTYDDQSTVVAIDKKEYFNDNLLSYHIYADTNNDGYINGRDWAYIVNS
ncbi:MAG: hypothetical protein IKF64_06200 [Eubacterium sp.]|nr:hypothetical protein [Eubacterium sp.]